jgi:CheY-like chemotaxis protein
MPVMDGWEFLEHFHVLAPKLAHKPSVYLCTSSNAPDDLDKARSIEYVKDYVLKPLQTGTFQKIVLQYRMETTETGLH